MSDIAVGPAIETAVRKLDRSPVRADAKETGDAVGIVVRRLEKTSSACGRLLTITPGGELQFTSSCSALPQATIHLQNTSDEFVAFKVKTTSREKYRVHPNFGRIRPGDSMNVSVCLQPGDSITKRDKFLVLSLNVDESVSRPSDLADKWRNVAPSNIVEHRLSCSMKPASESQGAPREEDQVAALKKQVSSMGRVNESARRHLRFTTTMLMLLAPAFVIAVCIGYYATKDRDRYMLQEFMHQFPL
ncbi:PREDICTED: motile sperm domain-containing protein 2-like [Priapulus caudatus]|uniref:Motile sperm domain-containing protein 2-like n=1 Tax=Priapulus caudatus TaxID=37621 RepID=A0ABM1DNV6_PRICU|nr:PREDICTED: motile sperm domain-containing protein 2-like [Priapulus caudatus]